MKAKTALPCLIAVFRSSSEDLRALLITSKASDEGKASVKESAKRIICREDAPSSIPFLRDIVNKQGIESESAELGKVIRTVADDYKDGRLFNREGKYTRELEDIYLWAERVEYNGR